LQKKDQNSNYLLDINCNQKINLNFKPN